MTLALEWTSPQALWALLLAIPLAAFSLYRLKRRRVVVAFLPLLQESGVGARAWSGWRRITEVGSLVARVLALAAVVFALAGPRPDGDPRPPETLILVLDGDVTTAADEGPSETRFQRQAALAKAHVRGHPRGPVAVVFAGPTPSVAFPPGEDRDAAAEAIGRLKIARTTADLGAALEVARDVGSRAPPARILVVSSRALPAVAPGSNPVPIEAVGAGIVSDDQGIVDQSAVPATDGVRMRVTWTVRNFARERRTRRLEATTGRSGIDFVGARDLTIEPGATAEASFDVLPGRDGGYVDGRLVSEQSMSGSERRVTGGDVFFANDVAVLRLDPPPRPSVLVAHGGAVRPFVTAVLDALGDAMDSEGSGAVAVADLPRAQRRDVLIVDGVALPKDAGAGIPTLFLAPLAGEGLPFAVGKAVEKPLVWRARGDHPLLRGVDLTTAFVARATPIEGAATGIAFADDAVVVGEGTHGPGGAPWIAFGLDPEGSDLPLRAALPVLLKNAIRLLGEKPAHALKPFYRAGEPIRPRTEVPLGEGPSLTLFRFDYNWRRDAPPAPRPFAWGDAAPSLGEPAVLRIRTTGPGDPGLTTYAVDLDPERDVTPVRPPSPAPPPAPAEVDVVPAWRRVLVLAALALLVLDLVLVLLARRRPVASVVVGAVPVRG